jgi:hypothetical protein
MKLNPSPTSAYSRTLAALFRSPRRAAVCPHGGPGHWGRSQTIALRRLLAGADAHKAVA